MYCSECKTVQPGRKTVGPLLKLLKTVTRGSSNSAPGYVPEEAGPQKDVGAQHHPNWPKVVATQVPINREMDKRKVVCTHI